MEAGYHEIEVDTWRPRGSIMTEIHSFFLGGSVRVLKLDELIRTQYLDENGQADIVNRFGLETEDAGKVRVSLNICYQNKAYFKAMRKEFNIVKIKEQQETKKRINEFKLKQMKEVNQQAKEDEEIN